MSWVTETARTIKQLSTPSHGRIMPEFPRVKASSVPAGAAILVAGTPGNILTERIGTNKYNFPFNPPYFHAALMMRDGIFHNVGKFRTEKLLTSLFLSTRRVDVIYPRRLLNQPDLVTRLMQNAELDTTEPKIGLNLPDYWVTGYLSFGFSFIRHGKALVCSGNVDKLWDSVGMEFFPNVPDHHVAPWDIWFAAMDKPQEFICWTVHVGADFKPEEVGK